MVSKVAFIVPSRDALKALVERIPFEGGCRASGLPDDRLIVVGYPHHPHGRFALAEEAGVIVLPGPHDPEPIGDLHKHFSHIDVKPEHTPRQMYLLLYAAHGSAALHPDV